MRATRRTYFFAIWFAILAAAVLATSTLSVAQPQALLLHSFNGTNGKGPVAGLIADKTGHLFGTTFQGGAHGYGTVFELFPNGHGGWTEKILHSFPAFDGDGLYPIASLTSDASGNLYSTTRDGGATGAGTVFELSHNLDGSWSETILHSFTSYSPDGSSPAAGVTFDSAGNIYGTTAAGGEGVCYGTEGYTTYGCGTLFQLSPNGHGGWVERILFNFSISAGAWPSSDLTWDAAGNLYGTTGYGGSGYCAGGTGCGTVFEFHPTTGGGWVEKVLYSFAYDSTITGAANAAVPQGGIVFDAAGNIYGTLYWGGAYYDGHRTGVVYELISNGHGKWKERILHSFDGGNGTTPYGNLIFDAAGNLYGTTAGSYSYNGTVYKLSPTVDGRWKSSVLHAFSQCCIDSSDRTGIVSGLMMDSAGSLFGTAKIGGSNNLGMVFEIKP